MKIKLAIEVTESQMSRLSALGASAGGIFECGLTICEQMLMEHEEEKAIYQKENNK